MTGGLIIAAPHSGSGKTIVTLGLLRLLHQKGRRVAAAKIGPDYIDPGFLAAACRAHCRNLDSWAMRPGTLRAQIAALEGAAELVICEGAMGLFDGVGPEGRGSTAEVAQLTGWPVVLVVNVVGQAQSVAALIEGFARHRAGVTVAGVIFNRIGSARHAATLKDALRSSLPEVSCLGAIPRLAGLELPSRHLGLIPANEHDALDSFLDRAAASLDQAVDIDTLASLARPARSSVAVEEPLLPPLGSRIAVARDAAFAFAYDAMLEAWRRQGATLSFFSPLIDEVPDATADAVYLPGGYPELFAARLAGNRSFMEGLRDAAARGAAIYGECGGYMVLGEALIAEDNIAYPMAGLLGVTTSFAERRLHLGYRAAALVADMPLGAAGSRFRGHEFHYASLCHEEGTPLFQIAGGDGAPLGFAGLIAGRVMGSFIHLIDRA